MKDLNKKTIKNLQLELDSINEKFKRVLADYQNQQKRHEDQAQIMAKYANESLLSKLLPIIDGLQKAKNHLKDEGLNHIANQLIQTLSVEGLEEIKTKDESFNPETMDCSEVVLGKKNIVVETLIPGYIYKDRLLRPAKVTVGNGVKIDHSSDGGAQSDDHSKMGH
jgi:molecular chaperone GrpE